MPKEEEKKGSQILACGWKLMILIEWILKLWHFLHACRKIHILGISVFEGAQDIKSSLRGAKLPNGQPMLLDEEQNSLALLIEQVCPNRLGLVRYNTASVQARHELNSGDPKKAEFYMNQADSINDQEPLVKIVRGICKVNIH